MRTTQHRNWVFRFSAALLLGFVTLGSNSALALQLEPGANIDGIPPVGWPGFVFNRNLSGSDYSNTIESWYRNTLSVTRSRNGKTYDLVVSNQGDFGYRADPDSLYAGTNGNFYLQARFGSGGKFKRGTVIMTGQVKELGINKRDRVLFSADIVAFETQGRVAGFAIENIRCANFIDACQDDPNIAESIYLRLSDKLPNIRRLGDDTFATSLLANVTTVPVPSSIWLMLSGLGFISAQAARRRDRKAAD